MLWSRYSSGTNTIHGHTLQSWLQLEKMGTVNSLHPPEKYGSLCQLLSQYPTIPRWLQRSPQANTRTTTHAPCRWTSNQLDETYGGTKHRNCHELLSRLQYTTEYSRILRQPSSVVTSNVEEAINHAMTLKYEQVQTYLCQRNEGTQDTFQLIDWQSFGRYFKSIPMAKRIKVSKYIHDWQNTGSRKEKFACSQHRKDPF